MSPRPALLTLLLPPLALAGDVSADRGDELRVMRAAARAREAADALEDHCHDVAEDGRLHAWQVVRIRASHLDEEVRTLEAAVAALPAPPPAPEAP